MLETTDSVKYIPPTAKDEICKFISRMIQDEIRGKDTS